MDSFECVLALAEFRNMTRAAEHLFMTQPALTLRIKRLEEELGFAIFDRSTRPISITRPGELYIHKMTELRIEEERLKNRLYQMSNHGRQTVTIGIGFNRGSYYLPALLPALLSELPEYDFQVQEISDYDMEYAVKSGELDYAITGSPVISAELAGLEIGTEQIYIAVPPHHAIFDGVEDTARFSLENPFVINLSDLDGETLILGSGSYGLTHYVNALLAAFHVVPEKIINIGSSQTSYLLAARGLGIAFTFRGGNLFLLEDERMRPVPCIIREAPLRRTVSLLCRASRAEDELTQALLAQIKSCVSRL